MRILVIGGTGFLGPHAVRHSATSGTRPLDFRQDLVIGSRGIREEPGSVEIVDEPDALARTAAWEVENM